MLQDTNNNTIYNAIENKFLEYFQNRNIDVETDFKTVPNNIYIACFRYIYRAYIQDLNITKDDISILDNIADIYIDLCCSYNCIVGIYGFSCLIGGLYSVDELRQGKQDATMPINNLSKKIYDNYKYMAESALNDDRVGLITNANNNIDIGLQYNKQQVLVTASARQLVSLSDLPKLSEIK